MNTSAQARALEARLAAHGRYLVRPCMRYWHPCAEEAISELRAAGVQRLVALPLYPQYCSASTGSSLLALERALQDGPALPLTVIRAWPDQPEYVSALARRVQEGLASFAALGGKTRLLYSAHNLPKRSRGPSLTRTRPSKSPARPSTGKYSEPSRTPEDPKD